MEETTNQENPEVTGSEEEVELGHSDKLVGVFSEPAETYSKTALFPPKTIDWFLPVLIMLVIVAITRIVLMSNEEIYFQMKEKQMEQINQRFDEAVKSGQMTEAQADQARERVREQMAMGRGATGMIIQSASILIAGFIFFFIVTGIYFLFARFVTKGDGTYKSALVANGLTAYIGIVQVILATILSLAFGRMLNDTSVAAFMGSDRTELVGFLLAKLDPITIWIYIILSIGLAKMFKSKSTGKYFVVVFGIWLIGSLLIFLLAQAIPFLKFLVAQS